jgi:hypothetical protein
VANIEPPNSGKKNVHLIKLEFLIFCQTLAKIGANENVKTLLFLLKFKDRLEKGKKLSWQILQRIKILFEDRDSTRYGNNIAKLRNRIKVAIELRWHIDFGHFLLKIFSFELKYHFMGLDNYKIVFN